MSKTGGFLRQLASPWVGKPVSVVISVHLRSVPWSIQLISEPRNAAQIKVQ